LTVDILRKEKQWSAKKMLKERPAKYWIFYFNIFSNQYRLLRITKYSYFRYLVKIHNTDELKQRLAEWSNDYCMTVTMTILSWTASRWGGDDHWHGDGQFEQLVIPINRLLVSCS